MNCREFIDFLMDYLDGELPDAQRRVFDQHLQHCPPCVRYLESYRQAIRLGQQSLHSEEPAALPPGVPERLLEAIRKARQQRDG
jgi:anti-sigma factor RsiW